MCNLLWGISTIVVMKLNTLFGRTKKEAGAYEQQFQLRENYFVYITYTHAGLRSSLEAEDLILRCQLIIDYFIKAWLETVDNIKLRKWFELPGLKLKYLCDSTFGSKLVQKMPTCMNLFRWYRFGTLILCQLWVKDDFFIFWKQKSHRLSFYWMKANNMSVDLI